MVNTKMSNIELLEKANTLAEYIDRHMELHNVEITDIREQLHHMLYLTERRKGQRHER